MNRKVLSTATKELNKAKAPAKPKDIFFDPSGMGMLNPNYAGKPVRLATDTLYNPTKYKIRAYADNGVSAELDPYDTTDVTLEGAKYIDEYPEMQNSGIYMDGDLSQEEIDYYAKGGFIIEDISVPQLTQAQNGLTKKSLAIADPKEYAYRKKAYDDSLNLYNFTNNRHLEAISGGGKLKEINDPDIKRFLKESAGLGVARVLNADPNIRPNKFYNYIYPNGEFGGGSMSYEKPKQPIGKVIRKPDDAKYVPYKKEGGALLKAQEGLTKKLSVNGNPPNLDQIMNAPTESFNTFKPNSVLAYNPYEKTVNTLNQSAYVKPNYHPQGGNYKYGFLGTNQGNIYGGAGYGIPKYGLEGTLFGTIPSSKNPYFKGFYNAGISKQFKNNKIGLSVGSPVTGYTDETGFNANTLELQPQINFKRTFLKGGALLTKKVTCKSCGWKWDAADGGDDITTCHKCGGQGLVHAQKGVQVNKKGTRNPALEEYMNRDMSQKYQIKDVPSETIQATANQKPKISQKVDTKKDVLGDLKKEKEAFAARQNKDQISKGKAPREAQSISGKLKDIVLNPMTAAGYAIRGQAIPDYLQESLDNGTYGYWANGVWHTERNPLDAVTDLSPIGLIHDASDTYEGIKNKDINQAGLGLLGFIPGVSEARKAKKVINAADATGNISKAIEFSGPVKHSYLDVPEVLGALKTRGAYWDKAGAKGEDLLHSDMINYHGTYAGRPLVEVKMPDGSSEMFYKSSGWAGKKGNANNGTTEGMWQVYGGHAPSSNSDNWFIKDKDYQNYYNSKTFGSMAENMDKALMQKYGFENVNELENAFNFQNRFGNVDSYTPKKQNGGVISQLSKKEIQELVERGYVIEEQ